MMNVKLHFSASCQTSCAWMVLPSHLLQPKWPCPTSERFAGLEISSGAGLRLTQVTPKGKWVYCWDSQGQK